MMTALRIVSVTNKIKVMNIHLLSGFLGSGKTTGIKQACVHFMQQGKRVGVITNDQGIKLVDGNFFSKMGIPERQVGNGCFCCNYNDLDRSIQSLIDEFKPDIIFAESVGSCTDIVATVLKPLLQFRSAGNYHAIDFCRRQTSENADGRQGGF